MPAKKVTQKQEDRVIAYKLAGYTYKQINQKTKIPISTIWRILRENKAMDRDNKKFDMQKMHNLLKEGKSIAEIARILNKPYTTIYSRIYYNIGEY